MICSFACTDTEALFHSQSVPRVRSVERIARRKWLQIHAATDLAGLRVPPGSELETLKPDRKGQHAIRIDDQWQICFVWRADVAYRVRIVDRRWEFGPWAGCSTRFIRAESCWRIS